MPTRGRTVRVAALVLLAATVPALSGCLSAEASIDVRDDRSATVEVLTLADATDVGALGGPTGVEQLAKVLDGLPDVDATAIERRGLPGLDVTIEVKDVAQLATPLTTPVRPGASARFFNRFDLTETPDGWLLAAEAVPLAQVVTGAPLPLAADDAKYELKITLPGSITGTNAKDQEKGTGYWTVGAAPQPISMRTRTGTTVNPALVVIGGALGVIVIGALVAVWGREASVRRRLKRQAAATIAAGQSGSWAPRPGTAAAAGSAAGPPSASVEGTYPEIHDGSVAVPVGGSAWGPPPPAASPAPPSTEPPTTGPAPTGRNPADEPSSAPASSAPVAGGPAPTALVPPGWYDDADRPGGRRYWDGSNWTEHRA